MTARTSLTTCPHCGFVSEDDEMCRACGALFEEIPVVPPREVIIMPETCPHCGFETEDPEYCPACGALFEEDAPVRHVTLTQVIEGFFSWLRDGEVHGVDNDDIFDDIDASDDPGLACLPGNSYHNIWLASHNED